MKILVLSRYTAKGASSRYRMYQYLPSLEKQGAEFVVKPLFDDIYLEKLYSKQNRFFSILKCYIRRFLSLLFLESFDLIWIEKELFPWMPEFFERIILNYLGVPFVVEYDDAIFHQYDLHRNLLVRKVLSKKCDGLMKNASCVIAGNSYLGQRARRAGANKVVEIPTVVSSQVFTVDGQENEIPIIGWIGSPSTAAYLEKMRPIFRELAKKHQFKFHIVGAQVDWTEPYVECIPWSASKEVAFIQSFDIGIMPLEDSPWEQGKCGFKLIQYMACGKAVIADPVGVNAKIVLDGSTGFLTGPQKSWLQALEELLLDKKLRDEMGQKSRLRFEEKYSREIWEGPLFTQLRLSAGFEVPNA
jgi:glycosyltransferase involved in cell wall biosynthesis